MNRNLLLLGGVGLLLFVGTACTSSGEEYNYSVPSRVCDIPVEKEAVRPLLPPGDSLTEREPYSTPRGERQFCVLGTESKKRGLTIQIARDTGIADVAMASDNYQNLKKVSLGNSPSAGVGEDGAIVWLDCVPKSGDPQSDSGTGGKYKALVMEVRVGVKGRAVEDPDGQRKSIDRFVRSYVPEVERVWCQSQAE